jgi:murein L,D-transpeptidase YcbB/YkuD
MNSASLGQTIAEERARHVTKRSGLHRAAALGIFAVALVGAAPGASGNPEATIPPPRHWDRATATELLGYVERIGSHGLEPADYAPEKLGWAIRVGNEAELERQATESFGLLARDLANGHVRPAQRRRFHVATPPIEPGQIALLIDRAIALGDVAEVLDGLAPQNAQYRGLRVALAELPVDADEQRRKLEASLERWRWMPRELGERHLLVNIPEYRVHLLEDGKETALHRVIVGKASTPTPQFSAQVTGVIFNPPWNVPQSIVAESVGSLVRNNPATARARGYTWSSSGGALRVTQQPGPQNALGQMKLDMPNPFTVYLHDTPSKTLFDREQRTLSHGCIRTDKPFDLATLLLEGVWTRQAIDEAVAGRQTVRIALERPLPVYVVYMPAFVEADGTVAYFGDPYALDAAVNRLLDDRAGG